MTGGVGDKRLVHSTAHLLFVERPTPVYVT
jgi:hypothetical protein